METFDDWRGEAHLRRAFTPQDKGARMARPRKNPITEEAEMSEPEEVQITYLPREDGDPVKVAWGGHTFHANIPKAIASSHAIVALARNNKHFHVGDFDPAKAVEIDEPTTPRTPDQYRAHAIAWVKTIQSVDELDRKWAGEETLRIDAGVGLDDLDYLGSIFAPIRAELRKRDQAGG